LGDDCITISAIDENYFEVWLKGRTSFTKEEFIMNQTNTSKRIPTQINEFRGDYAFLSNFYPAPISYMGQTYANNEAAFQAQKTLSAREQRKFCIFRMHNPSDAKKLGRDLTLRPDWEKVKVRFMYEICMCKFMQNPELRDKLLATGESTLVEGNNWGDYFWGKVNNCGENQLGIILMDVRAKLQWNAETAPNNIPQCLQ
jgi:ribA/ribD-fused uncharacterized protein